MKVAFEPAKQHMLNSQQASWFDRENRPLSACDYNRARGAGSHFVQWLGRLSVTLVLAIVCYDSNAAIYQLEGTLERTVNNPMTGAVIDSKNCFFVVGVSNDCWLIQTKFGENDWIEFGSDGADVYSVLYDPDQKASGSYGVVRPANVTPGTYPAEADPFTATIWLALASGSFTSKYQQEVLPVPWTMPLMDPTALIFANQSQFTESTHLPLAIKFTVAKSLLEGAATNRPFGGYFDNQSLKWLNGYSAGVLGGRYEVSAVTNVETHKFPSSFLLSRNDPLDGKVFEKYIGNVLTIRVGAAAVHLPKLPNAVGVSDFRFREEQKIGGVAYINYVITNQTWMPQSDSGLQAVFEKRKKTWGMPSHEDLKTSSFSWIRGVLFVIAVGPILFWAARKAITRKPSTT